MQNAPSLHLPPAEILASTLHTLASPLTSLHFQIHTLETHQHSCSACQAQQHTVFKGIKKNLTQLRVLCDSIQPDSNPRHTRDNLGDVLKNVLKTSRMTAQLFRVRISMKTEFSHSIPHILAPTIFFQILHPVLTNAIEATALTTCPQKAVSISVKESRARITIQIRDTGIGFGSPGSTPQPKKPHSHGIGLILADRLMQHTYHGKIECLSSCESGTIMQLEFPKRFLVASADL